MDISHHHGPESWKNFRERRAKIVVERIRCFSQKVGAQACQQANLVHGLNQMIRREHQMAKDLKKVAGSPLPNRLVCRIGKLKSFPIIYSSSTKAYKITNN